MLIIINALTQPREPLQHVRQYCCFGHERRDQVDDEEEQPAGDEAAHHDRQCLRGLVLALQRHPAIVTSAQAASNPGQ